MYLGAKIEGRHTADYILSEGNGAISRENVTMAQSAIVEPGTVLGIVTATGKFMPLDLAATDGTEVAAAVNYARVDASAADVACVISARASELKIDQLIWPAGISAPEKATAIAQMKTHNLIAR